MLKSSMKGSRDDQQMTHDFVRDKASGFCTLCKNLWSSKDMITSKFQVCTVCGLSVHTNCRSVAQACIACDVDTQRQSEDGLPDVTGWFHLKVIHAYDINVTAGTSLYAQVRLHHNTQSLRSLTADSGQSDCLWETNHEVATQLTALKFHIQQTIPKSEDIWKELKVEVEIWSTFLGFFDTCLATTEINVAPVFFFPGKTVERWFTLHNKVIAESDFAEGKLLLSMQFESLAPPPPAPIVRRPTEKQSETIPIPVRKDSSAAHAASALSSTTEKTAVAAAPVPAPVRSPEQSRTKHTEKSPELAKKSISSPSDKAGGGKDVKIQTQDSVKRSEDGARPTKTHGPVHVDPATRAATLSKIAEITAAATGESPPAKLKLSSSPAVEKHPASEHVPVAPAKTRHTPTEGRSRSNTTSSQADASSNHTGKAVAAATTSSNVTAHATTNINNPPSTPERPRRNSADVVSATSPPIKSTTTITTKEDTKEPPAPSAPVDFYQSIAEFTERTTNTIGNFFYEIEALNLTSASRDAIDGDWNDSHKLLPVPTKPGEVAPASTSTAKSADSAPALGVGYMHIHVVSAFKSRVKDVADGDHYILACVEDTKREFKSKSVFGSATPIFNVRWTIKMEHFRSAVNLYLMDAHSHRRLATARLSCYALMQRDVDRQIKSWKEAPTEQIILRGVSDNEEMGYLTAQASFEEDVDGLFLKEPLHDAPLSPPEAFSVQRLGAHIARFTAIIELVNLWYAEFLYITEWQDPMTTFVVFLLFLYCTLKVQAEYALSGVMFAVVVLMTRSWLRRRNGQYVKHYIEVGVKAMPKLDYKPIARMRISVLGFRNISPARDRKTSGETAQGHVNFNRPSMKVTFQPMLEVDKAVEAPSEHVVGYFGNSLGGVGFAIPEPSQGVSQLVSNMVVGAEVLQRDAILHNVYDPWPLENHTLPVEKDSAVIKSITPDLSLVYPVLQPLSAKIVPTSGKPKKSVENSVARAKSPSQVEASGNEADAPSSSYSTLYVPWERNESCVKVSFIDDQHSSFGGPNEESVEVPLKDVVMSAAKPLHREDKMVYEMTKWYRITKPKQKGLLKTDSRNELDLFAYDSASSIYLSSTDRDTGNLAEDVGIRRQLAIVPPGAEVCVRVELEVPSASASLNPSHEQKESSFVLQTLLKGNEKESSTISVLWNLTDNVKYVQNMMNGLLDQIESLKNLLNWTSPSKTFPLYVALVAVWLVTILVPGRLIVLAIGLYEFFFVFMPIPEGRNTMIRFGNLVQSIPNDDDLAQIYGTEKKAYAASKQAEWKHTEKSRKLQLVLDSPWHGLVSIKGSSSSSGHLAGSGEEWVEVFLLLQGRRLVWWVSEEALDQGKMAAGQLLLCGHSGLAQVSPMDIRKFGGDSRLIAVFGQDYVGRPQKLSILLQDSDSKQSLYALLNALSS